MFRMLQLLEREPQENPSNTEQSNQVMFDPTTGRTTTMTINASLGAFPGPSDGIINQPYPHHMNPHHQIPSSSSPLRRENPHKYLLYRPSFSQLFVFLASGFKELPANGVLLLYLSADGVFANIKHPEDYGYDFGGVITNS